MQIEIVISGQDLMGGSVLLVEESVRAAIPGATITVMLADADMARLLHAYQRVRRGWPTGADEAGQARPGIPAGEEGEHEQGRPTSGAGPRECD